MAPLDDVVIAVDSDHAGSRIGAVAPVNCRLVSRGVECVDCLRERGEVGGEEFPFLVDGVTNVERSDDDRHGGDVRGRRPTDSDLEVGSVGVVVKLGAVVGPGGEQHPFHVGQRRQFGVLIRHIRFAKPWIGRIARPEA